MPLLLLSGCRSRSQTGFRRAACRAFSFDGVRAFGYLSAQCAFGVRPPGSAAHEKCKAYILQQLTPNVDKVSTQTFNYHDFDRKVTLHLTNIIGVINPSAKKKAQLKVSRGFSARRVLQLATSAGGRHGAMVDDLRAVHQRVADQDGFDVAHRGRVAA